MNPGALESFLNKEEHKKDTKDSETIKTPLTKEQEESLITNELRNINKELGVLNKNMDMFDLFLKVAIIYMIIVLTVALLTYSKLKQTVP